MLKLLQFLWSGCWHKWEEDCRAEAYLPGHSRPVGFTSFCHCEHCGAHRSFRMMA